MRKKEGGLFLVRKQFFPFFENIMNRLICFFHENKLSNSNHALNEFHRKLRLHDDENSAWIMFCNAWIDLNFFNVTNLSVLSQIGPTNSYGFLDVLLDFVTGKVL